MAISSSTVWEVRTTGTATSGGGYVAGSGTTDFSQQPSPQVAVTNAVANGTTTITSATAGFTAAMVGNILYLAGGSGSLAAGWYQLVTFTNSTTIVVDRTVAAGTAITLNLGGALDSPTTLAAAMAASNKAFIQAGTYTSAATITFGAASVTPTATVPYTHILGYNTVRGDIVPGSALARPQVLCSSLNTDVLAFTNNGWKVANLIIGPSVVATCGRGISVNGTFSVNNCKVFNYSVNGIVINGSSGLVIQCEVTGGTAGSAIVTTGANLTVCENWIHDNAGSGGILVGSNCNVRHNLIANNTGRGIQVSNGCYVAFNTVYKSTTTGILWASGANFQGTFIKNNLLVQNSAFGIQSDTNGTPASYAWDGNAYFSNTSGARSQMDDTTVNPVDGVSPYTNTLDVTLSANPFVNAAGNDFRLNNTPGGGAACRGHGVPASWPAVTFSAYPDMGAVQHQDPATAVMIGYRRKVR